jgi:hypothetical protein
VDAPEVAILWPFNGLTSKRRAAERSLAAGPKPMSMKKGRLRGLFQCGHLLSHRLTSSGREYLSRPPVLFTSSRFP